MNNSKVKIVLDVAYQPQVRTDTDTRRIMMDVIIALMPALIVAILQFGWRPLGVAVVSMLSAVFFEWAYRKLMKKSNTIGDCSAALTGLLMAMTMPPSSPSSSSSSSTAALARTSLTLRWPDVHSSLLPMQTT